VCCRTGPPGNRVFFCCPSGKCPSSGTTCLA
jgi:hypothetical protein